VIHRGGIPYNNKRTPWDFADKRREVHVMEILREIYLYITAIVYGHWRHHQRRRKEERKRLTDIVTFQAEAIVARGSNRECSGSYGRAADIGKHGGIDLRGCIIV
jgi:hypothetical protein